MTVYYACKNQAKSAQLLFPAARNYYCNKQLRNGDNSGVTHITVWRNDNKRAHCSFEAFFFIILLEKPHQSVTYLN